MNQKGITIVGLLITVIVIVTIAGVCINTGSSLIEEAKQTELETNILLIQAAGKTLYDKKTLDKNIPLEGIEILYKDKQYYILDKGYLERLGLNIEAYEIEDEIEDDITEDILKSNSNLYIIDYETNDVIYLANADWNKVNISGLPSEYQQIEYIQSTGSQYIDLGVKPTNNSKVEMEFEVVKNSVTLSQYITGSRASTSSTIFFALNGSGSDLYWDCRFDGKIAMTDLQRKAENKYRNILEVEYNEQSGYRGKFIVNDLVSNVTDTVYTDYSKDGISNTSNMFLFAYNANNVHSGLKVYSYKFWDSNKLILDLIPCCRTSDGVVGMYDTVEGKFYTNTNKGTGAFTAGNNV